MLGELLLTLGIGLICYAFHKLSTNSAKYFEERNLEYAGLFSVLKTLLSVCFGTNDVLTTMENMYDIFPDVPIYGRFDFSVRQYVVRDPEAFKRIAIKDFDYFEDHRSLVDEKIDELFGNSLLSLKGGKWRQMRATLSPAFTGSKMRQMFELISECADEMVHHFRKRAANGEKIDIEMKNFFSRYTNDVIATCAFGVKVNSVENPDNEFFLSGTKLANFRSGFFSSMKFFVTILIPKIVQIFKIKLFDESATDFFKNVIMDTIHTRLKNNIYRPDMVNMLMQVREGNCEQQQSEELQSNGFATVEESQIGQATVTRKWNDIEIIAQCFVFFFAGFEVTSNTLTSAAYELMANPDIQQKLYEEIAEVNEQIRGKRITYDTLQQMKYMDQVISEALRKWPAVGQIDRLCVKDYVYDDGKLKFKIEKESNIIVTVYGIHRDPKYYPNPEKFDPERFSDENKHKIVPGSYLPFGMGPRNCIGSRFALMELKAILYYLLLNFSFEPNKDTQIPLKLKKGAKNGVHLELKPRSMMSLMERSES